MIYLDYNASTPLDPRVRESVVAALDRLHGNAASVHHAAGLAASEAVSRSREQVAQLLHAAPQDVIFTSGASEALNLAIYGCLLADAGRPNVVISAVEHKAVIAAAENAARLSGGVVEVVSVTEEGLVHPDALRESVNDRVGLVAVMHANNETGAVNDVQAMAEIAHSVGATFLCDVTQSVGKLHVDVTDLGADIAVLSSHKIYGPKGAGALVANRLVQRSIVPLFGGGGQERGLRGGTQDTPAIVGFGEAAEIAHAEHISDSCRMRGLLAEFLVALHGRVPQLRVLGPTDARLPNTANIRFVGADAEAIMACAPQIAVSTGSACQSAVPSVSHVLLAMGLTRAEASECLRVSIGRPTSSDELRTAAMLLGDAVDRVRSMTAA